MRDICFGIFQINWLCRSYQTAAAQPELAPQDFSQVLRLSGELTCQEYVV
jgi:hypothetical protein